MTILVTGSAGFIGHAVCLALLERGEKVIGVDLDERRPEAVERHALVYSHPNFLFYREDVSVPEIVDNLVAVHEVDGIVHCAGKAGVRCPEGEAMDYGTNNLLTMIAVLEACRKHDIRLTYASSSSVYDSDEQRPHRETDPRRPGSLYAVTKASAEMMAQIYADVHGVRSVGLRFFSVYGPRGRPDMAPLIFAHKLMHKETISIFGWCRRDFTYIDDIVDGVMAVLDSDLRGHELFNLGAGRPTDIAEFGQMLSMSLLGSPTDMTRTAARSEEMRWTWANNDKAKRMLGWEPKVGLDVGIQRLADWYRGSICSR